MEKLPTCTVEKSALYLEIDKHRGIHMAGCRRMAKSLVKYIMEYMQYFERMGQILVSSDHNGKNPDAKPG